MILPHDEIGENGDKVGATLSAPNACYILEKSLHDVEANGDPAYDERSLTHADPDARLLRYLPNLWDAIKFAIACALRLMPIVGTAMDAASYLPASVRREIKFMVTLLLVSFVSTSITSAFFGPLMILYDWTGSKILHEFYGGRAVLGYFFAGWGLMVPLGMLDMMVILFTPISEQRVWVHVVYFICRLSLSPIFDGSDRCLMN